MTRLCHMIKCHVIKWVCGAVVVLTTTTIFTQTDDGLRYKVNYQCNGETVQVSYCRHDRDDPSMPRTIPQNDYCLVYYPDRPKAGGFTVQKAELRGDVVRKLQACGALASPQGQSSAQNASEQSSSAQNTTAQPAAAAPASADSYYQQGLQYANAKQFPQAAEAFKKSVAIRPTAQAYGALGLVYFNLKQYPEAIAAFQKTVQLAPTVGEYQYDLGFLYYVTKQYSQAVDPLREAVRLKPSLADPYVALGTAYIALGKMDEALKVYRALQKLDQEKADKLYLDITKTDLDAKSKAKPSATTRAEAYKNLDLATLQAKAAKGDDAAMKRLADVYYAQKDSANGLKWTIAAAERGDAELQNDRRTRPGHRAVKPLPVIRRAVWIGRWRDLGRGQRRSAKPDHAHSSQSGGPRPGFQLVREGRGPGTLSRRVVHGSSQRQRRPQPSRGLFRSLFLAEQRRPEIGRSLSPES
jgi:tetratricopeptide (TPR) repeat protein